MTSPALHDVEGRGVYQVFTGLGTGSGFLIDPTHLVTNCHVVAPYRDVAVEMRDRSRIVGRVRCVHPRRDLAIVELSRPVAGAVFALADGAPLAAKQRIHILGFPVGLPLSLTEGVVSHPRQRFDEQHFVQTDAAINPGNSGGPILDDAGRVVAVTTCKIDSAESVGFGIPVADVHAFLERFRAQTAAFAALCPACEELIDRAVRYCPSCGLDVAGHEDLDHYFNAPDPHPLVAFVENALVQANVDPVLARHGEQNWSFHSGSAPINVWCCCSEHLNLSSPMVHTPQRGMKELFAYLLSAEHAPFAFDLNGNTIRLNHVVHTSDVFDPACHADFAARMREFIAKADVCDNVLIQRYGCTPAPETRLEPLRHDVLSG
jgi:serine protease Do